MKKIQLIIGKSILKSKRIYGIMGIIFINYLLFNSYMQNYLVQDVGYRYNMYDMYFSIYRDIIYVLLLIPLYIYLIAISSDFFDSHNIRLNYGNVKTWWRDKVINIALISAFYCLFIHIANGLLITLIFKNIPFSLEYLGLEIAYTILNYLAFNILGLIYLFFSAYMKNKYYGYLFSLSIVFFDLIALHMRLKFNIIIKLTVTGALVSLGTVEKIVSIGYVILLFLVLYQIFYEILQNKDF